MERLKATALHPGGLTGKDNKVGFGMINPVAALTAVLPAEAAGFKAQQPKELTTSVTPPQGLDWPPIIVALSGIGIGGLLLALTLFIRNSLNRKKGHPA
jgi:membrane-anchored mycosin MYCP